MDRLAAKAGGHERQIEDIDYAVGVQIGGGVGRAIARGDESQIHDVDDSIAGQIDLFGLGVDLEVERLACFGGPDERTHIVMIAQHGHCARRGAVADVKPVGRPVDGDIPLGGQAGIRSDNRIVKAAQPAFGNKEGLAVAAGRVGDGGP